MSMAVVSHPALSAEWSFPSPITPYDAPNFGSHIDLDHTSVHHIPIGHKRCAHEIDWDNEELGQRADSRAKKAKTSPCYSVEPHQLHKESATPAVQTPSTAPSPPQIEQVISIIVDALKSGASTTSSSSPSDPPINVLPSNVPAKPTTARHPTPTSPLSNSPNRAPYVRKVIGGSCAGKIEPRLYRWVLCKNHFLRVRYLDPTKQTEEWVQTLHEMGWEELHPYFQAQVAAQSVQTFGTLSAFSRWIEDDFDYDATEDVDGDWSDEDEDSEIQDEMQEEDDEGQTDPWDSGVVLQFPGKSS